jgi:hypothetical protein
VAQFTSTEQWERQFDRAAPIVPNRGLGGLQLRVSLASLQSFLAGLGVFDRGAYGLVAPFDARYRMDDYCVEIAADPRNGRVFRLSALPGYEGLLLGGIRVGMSVQDAIRIAPFELNEMEGVLELTSAPGVVLEVDDPDPDPRLLARLPVARISVFAVEIESLAGQSGEWLPEP